MKKTLLSIYKFFAKWNEILTIPIALILWHHSPQILRMVDPTAATFDYGIFQIILFAIIQFLIYHGVAWLLFKWTWPKMYKFLDNTLESIIFGNGSITTWEKIKLVMWIFTLYLGGLIILSKVIS
jgi:hypothetical protein